MQGKTSESGAASRRDESGATVVLSRGVCGHDGFSQRWCVVTGKDCRLGWPGRPGVQAVGEG